MIRHFTLISPDVAQLADMFAGSDIAKAARTASAVLVQIYTADADRSRLARTIALITDRLPEAVVVGATTVGEVAHGRLLTGQTVIGLSFFESSSLRLVSMACADGEEYRTGAELGQRIGRGAKDVAGVLLLATPLSLDAATLLSGIESTVVDTPVFGGGAGDYAAMRSSLIFTAGAMMEKGAIAVVFCGRDLHIEARTYLGWRPLSKRMRVTDIDGLLVRRVDDKPAFDVYQRYLNIPNDDQFFLNALEFPFLFERDGELVARVPIAADADGALQFVADVREGDSFRIGYGDLELIVEDARQIHEAMAGFTPEVLFLYTCGCRRFLMQDDADLETAPFERIAPTFGFYTYGEFFGASRLTLLNSTMVAVGMREGPRRLQPPGDGTRTADPAKALPALDPYANKHARVVSRLVRFIDAVTSELETSNREVTKLSLTDQLTQLVNRNRLDQVIDEQIRLASRYGIGFSVILLDIDHFKQVNDTYGHLAGDRVLVRVAEILLHNLRSVDVAGRWGGEEFLIVVPNSRREDALLLAEKLRAAIGDATFPVPGRRTGSFGVASYTGGDDPGALIARADAALYLAKHAGRNRVEPG